MDRLADSRACKTLSEGSSRPCQPPLPPRAKCGRSYHTPFFQKGTARAGRTMLRSRTRPWACCPLRRASLLPIGRLRTNANRSYGLTLPTLSPGNQAFREPECRRLDSPKLNLAGRATTIYGVCLCRRRGVPRRPLGSEPARPVNRKSLRAKRQRPKRRTRRSRAPASAPPEPGRGGHDVAYRGGPRTGTRRRPRAGGSAVGRPGRGDSDRHRSRRWPRPKGACLDGGKAWLLPLCGGTFKNSGNSPGPGKLLLDSGVGAIYRGRCG